MSWKKFLTSPVFFKNFAIALLIVAASVFGVMKFLSVATNHGEEIPVPNLSKMSVEKAEERLNDIDLELQLLDTVDFNPAFPPYSIVEQDPLPAVTVKDGRKVYVKINSGGYSKVVLPELVQKTYRQALSTLRALGLEEGDVKYVEYMAKDVVLEVKQNGKTLKAGDRILKSSKIDFVLGDGKTGFQDEEMDSINASEQLAPAPAEEDAE
ncbi:putative transmembrane PASTA-domain protein [Flavobacterium limnosediminis JC2902]|uniref:Putative transmembrane PASTA-domain protein n=1 Tax=Flavobacterium limnosediminis JC2902 TaxID=1341181 RepID=V6SME9_9FLAO|nr:PASTA domain-containing protein [Flavobacterium limnosediminis]ESU27604.1 putative transmembrane PASTA-domain protein [Flavobacterium limnosediminis JC2902]